MSARELDDVLLVWIVPLVALAAVPLLVGHLATVLRRVGRTGHPGPRPRAPR
jgi:hypothetical protein